MPIANAPVLVMKALKIIAFLLIAVIIIAATALALFDPNRFKDEIALLVEDRTGFDVEINGDIDYSIWNPNGLEIGETVVTREQNAVLRWDTAEVDIALDPLLSKGLVINELRLEKPRLNLDSGIIETITDPPAAADEPTEPAADRPLPLAHFAILDLRVDDLALNFQLDEQPLSVGQLDLSLKDLTLIQEHAFDPQRVTAELTLTAAGMTHPLAGLEAVTLKGRLRDGGIIIEELKLDQPSFKPSQVMAMIPEEATADKTLPVASVVIQHAAIHGFKLDDQFRGEPVTLDNVNLTLDDVRLVQDHQFDLQHLAGKLQLTIDQASHRQSRLGRISLEGHLADAGLHITRLDVDGPKLVLDQLLGAFIPSDGAARKNPAGA